MKRIHVVGESKWESFKVEVNNTYEDVKIWCYNNRILLIKIAIPLVTTVVPIIAKRAIRAHDLRKLKDVKELYCYDRSLGHYWKLKRELTNDEWLYIDKRKADGERLSDILDELKVLK